MNYKTMLAACAMPAAMLAAATLPWGAMAQTRTYLVHFDGSCVGMTLHVTNGRSVVGNSVGCNDTAKAYAGKVLPGNVADVTSQNDSSDRVTLNYKIGLRDNTWVLFKKLDGTTEEIGNGFWTKRGPTVEVNSVPIPPSK